METIPTSSQMMQVNGKTQMEMEEATILVAIMEIDSQQTLLNGTTQIVMAMEIIKMEMSQTSVQNLMEHLTIL